MVYSTTNRKRLFREQEGKNLKETIESKNFGSSVGLQGLTGGQLLRPYMHKLLIFCQPNKLLFQTKDNHNDYFYFFLRYLFTSFATLVAILSNVIFVLSNQEIFMKLIKLKSVISP